MAEPTIAAGFAKAFLDFAVSKGADRKTLIERVFPSRTDIPVCPSSLPDTLDEESRTDIPVCHSFLTDTLDPINDTNRVPLASYIELMKAGIELCHEPALALLFGEEVRLPDISIVGVLGRAETAEEARLQASRYSRLAIDGGESESGSPLEFVKEDRNVWLKFNSALYIEHPLLTETAFAHCVSGRGAMSGSRDGSSRWPYPKAFSFSHAEPSYRAEYDRIFRVPLIFGSDKNAILFGEELLSVRLPPMNRYVSRLLIQQGDALLTKLDSSKSAKSMRARVEKLLLPMLPTGEASVEIVAAKLGVSRQTLFRKLKAEGVNFEKVLDELRHKLALQYLDDKKMSVNETGYLVGFSDAAAFSRAFKRWTGSSPRLRNEVSTPTRRGSDRVSARSA